MRKLVTKRIVSNITPIQNAQRIELISVDGWSCIAKKGEFTIGDTCLYFEIDSFIPASDRRFDFLGKQKTYKKKQGYRIKTMKMRGVISMGLALPLSMFPELSEVTLKDYSQLLNVEKYDIEVASPRGGLNTGNAKGKFPSFIQKTDQERIENLLHYFQIYKDHEFQETLKLEGSSLSVFKVPAEITLWARIKAYITRTVPTSYRFGVCSRNLEIKPSDKFETTFDNNGKPSTYKQSDFWSMAKTLRLEQKIPEGYAFQFELLGPKIQGGHEGSVELEAYCFDVYDITNQTYLLPKEAEKLCLELKVPYVPVVANSIKIFTECNSLELLQERVTGDSFRPGVTSEGRVYKSCSIPGLSFKSISPEYLVKQKG